MNHIKKIKILCFSHSAGLDGAEKSLLLFLSGIDKNKYEPIVILPRDGLLRKELESLKIKTIIYSIQTWIPPREEFGVYQLLYTIYKTLANMKGICKIVERENIDIVYTNSIVVIDGALVAKLMKIPHIWHIREIIDTNASLRSYIPVWLVHKIVCMLSVRIVAVSNAVKEKINISTKNRYNKNVIVIFNAVDTNDFDEDSHVDMIRKNLNIDNDTKLVGTVGAFLENKGHDTIIESARIVLKNYPNTLFLFVGSGNEEIINALKEKARLYNIDKNIIFHKYTDSIIHTYQMIDVLVSASFSESFGRTLIEAMAASKPVIATRCGGPSDIVIDGETGILITPGSPLELSEAIGKIVNDSCLAKKMGTQGRMRVEKVFNVVEYRKRVLDVMEDAIFTKRKSR